MDLCTVIGTAWWVECVHVTHVGLFVFYNFFLIFVKWFFFKKDLLLRKSVRYTGLQNYEIVPLTNLA